MVSVKYSEMEAQDENSWVVCLICWMIERIPKIYSMSVHLFCKILYEFLIQNNKLIWIVVAVVDPPRVPGDFSYKSWTFVNLGPSSTG